MSEQQPRDEFERRTYLTGTITTLADAVAKMNPTLLVSPTAQQIIEAGGLKEQFQAVTKKWLDMVGHFIEKVDRLGSLYPIEGVIGIKEAYAKP